MFHALEFTSRILSIYFMQRILLTLSLFINTLHYAAEEIWVDDFSTGGRYDYVTGTMRVSDFSPSVSICDTLCLRLSEGGTVNTYIIDTVGYDNLYLQYSVSSQNFEGSSDHFYIKVTMNDAVWITFKDLNYNTNIQMDSALFPLNMSNSSNIKLQLQLYVFTTGIQAVYIDNLYVYGSLITPNPTASNPTSFSPTTSNPTTSNPTIHPTTTPTTSNPSTTTPNPTTSNPTTINPSTTTPTTSNPTINPSTLTPTVSHNTGIPTVSIYIIPTAAPQFAGEGEQIHIESTVNNVDIMDKKNKMNSDSMVFVISIVVCVIIILLISIIVIFILIKKKHCKINAMVATKINQTDTHGIQLSSQKQHVCNNNMNTDTDIQFEQISNLSTKGETNSNGNIDEDAFIVEPDEVDTNNTTTGNINEDEFVITEHISAGNGMYINNIQRQQFVLTDEEEVMTNEGDTIR